MPQRKERKRDTRGRIEGILRDLGLAGDYDRLIDRAIRLQWTPSEFEFAVRRSGTFRRQFPGLVRKNGQFNSFVAAQAGQSLAGALQFYRQYTFEAQEAAERFGRTLGKNAIGALIKGGNSVDEFVTKLTAVHTAQQNPELLANLNANLKALGQPQIPDNQTLYKALAKQAPRDFYDAYEAAYLQSRGFNLGNDAIGFARTLGEQGVFTGSLSDLANEAIRQYSAIGPELERQGFNQQDLLRLAAGQDDKGVGNVVSQLIAGRQALSRRQTGTFARQGTGGGPTLFSDDAGSAD